MRKFIEWEKHTADHDHRRCNKREIVEKMLLRLDHKRHEERRDSENNTAEREHEWTQQRPPRVDEAEAGDDRQEQRAVESRTKRLPQIFASRDLQWIDRCRDDRFVDAVED